MTTGFRPVASPRMAACWCRALRRHAEALGGAQRQVPAHPGGACGAVMSLWLLPGWQPAGVGLLDGTLKLWEVRSGKCLRTLEGHGDGVRACGFSPDGRLLVSGAWDGTLKLWEVRSGKCVRTLERS